jgi:hypothetical protein
VATEKLDPTSSLRVAVDEISRRLRRAGGVIRRGDPNTVTICGACRTGEPCDGSCGDRLDGRTGGQP